MVSRASRRIAGVSPSAATPTKPSKRARKGESPLAPPAKLDMDAAMPPASAVAAAVGLLTSTRKADDEERVAAAELLVQTTDVAVPRRERLVLDWAVDTLVRSGAYVNKKSGQLDRAVARLVDTRLWSLVDTLLACEAVPASYVVPAALLDAMAAAVRLATDHGVLAPLLTSVLGRLAGKFHAYFRPPVDKQIALVEACLLHSADGPLLGAAVDVLRVVQLAQSNQRQVFTLVVDRLLMGLLTVAADNEAVAAVFCSVVFHDDHLGKLRRVQDANKKLAPSYESVIFDRLRTAAADNRAVVWRALPWLVDRFADALEANKKLELPHVRKLGFTFFADLLALVMDAADAPREDRLETVTSMLRVVAARGLYNVNDDNETLEHFRILKAVVDHFANAELDLVAVLLQLNHVLVEAVLPATVALAWTRPGCKRALAFLTALLGVFSDLRRLGDWATMMGENAPTGSAIAMPWMLDEMRAPIVAAFNAMPPGQTVDVGALLADLCDRFGRDADRMAAFLATVEVLDAFLSTVARPMPAKLVRRLAALRADLLVALKPVPALRLDVTLGGSGGDENEAVLKWRAKHVRGKPSTDFERVCLARLAVQSVRMGGDSHFVDMAARVIDGGLDLAEMWTAAIVPNFAIVLMHVDALVAPIAERLAAYVADPSAPAAVHALLASADFFEAPAAFRSAFTGALLAALARKPFNDIDATLKSAFLATVPPAFLAAGETGEKLVAIDRAYAKAGPPAKRALANVRLVLVGIDDSDAPLPAEKRLVASLDDENTLLARTSAVLLHVHYKRLAALATDTDADAAAVPASVMTVHNSAAAAGEFLRATIDVLKQRVRECQDRASDRKLDQSLPVLRFPLPPAMLDALLAMRKLADGDAAVLGLLLHVLDLVGSKHCDRGEADKTVAGAFTSLSLVACDRLRTLLLSVLAREDKQPTDAEFQFLTHVASLLSAMDATVPRAVVGHLLGLAQYGVASHGSSDARWSELLETIVQRSTFGTYALALQMVQNELTFAVHAFDRADCEKDVQRVDAALHSLAMLIRFASSGNRGRVVERFVGPLLRLAMRLLALSGSHAEHALAPVCPGPVLRTLTLLVANRDIPGVDRHLATLVSAGASWAADTGAQTTDELASLCRFYETAVRVRPKSVLRHVVPVMGTVRTALLAVVRRGAATADSDADVALIAEQLARLLEHLCVHRKAISKYAVYALLDYFGAQETYQIPAAVKRALLPGIQALIAVCSDYEFQQLHISLDHAGRELFNVARTDYEAVKFRGKA